MSSKNFNLESILNGFGGRLAEIMQDQEVSAYQVAKDLGIRADTIYNIVNKRQYANLKLIVELLLLFPEVNANWFVLGKGPKYLEDLEDLLRYRTNNEQRQKDQETFIQSLRALVNDYEKSLDEAGGNVYKFKKD